MRNFDDSFDVIVVGGGHAGCEAAAAASKMGARTALFTLNLDLIAQMSCNPAVGGIAKGHLVREIDAMGGVMAKVADRTGIQFRLLNASRGPAVQAPRCQSDKAKYRNEMRALLETRKDLFLQQAEVVGLVLGASQVEGIELLDGRRIGAGAVVMTTGTYLNGLIHIGESRYPGGRNGENASLLLAQYIKTLGVSTGRLKTGTPPRLDGRTIDYSFFEAQHGDPEPTFFSFETNAPVLTQIACHIGYTNAHLHDLLRKNLARSPLYSGRIVGIGPRYCPSIEDKVVKFADKERHQIFLEPEGLETHEVYLNGMSTSMPADLQREMVHSVRGLENARMIRPGYAIEYDFVHPTELLPTLETKKIKGLFHAGQINGTTGYEEAAAQGLIAGINAALKAGSGDAVQMPRQESYLGILIDDLVTKGVDEPYRMFTSRSELRLLLRIDNADYRLCPIGWRLGLVSQERYDSVKEKYREAEELRRFLRNHRWDLSDGDCHGLQDRVGVDSLKGSTLEQLLRRADVKLSDLKPSLDRHGISYSAQVQKTAELEVRFEGYIQMQKREAERLAGMSSKTIPSGFDYNSVNGLSREIREKLIRIRPADLGMASRIPGVTPAAVAILNVYLETHRSKRAGTGKEPEGSKKETQGHNR